MLDTEAREGSAKPAAVGAPVVDTRALGCRFGQIVALEGISLTVARGEMIALIGPNGAGKRRICILQTQGYPWWAKPARRATYRALRMRRLPVKRRRQWTARYSPTCSWLSCSRYGLRGSPMRATIHTSGLIGAVCVERA